MHTQPRLWQEPRLDSSGVKMVRVGNSDTAPIPMYTVPVICGVVENPWVSPSDLHPTTSPTWRTRQLMCRKCWRGHRPTINPLTYLPLHLSWLAAACTESVTWDMAPSHSWTVGMVVDLHIALGGVWDASALLLSTQNLVGVSVMRTWRGYGCGIGSPCRVS
jgi:hypothetical protein